MTDGQGTVFPTGDGSGSSDQPTQHGGSGDYAYGGAAYWDATQLGPQASVPPTMYASVPPAVPPAPPPVYAQMPPTAPQRSPGGLQPQHWAVLTVCAVAVIAIVVVTSILLNRGSADSGDETTASPGKGQDDSAPVGVEDVVPCSSAPTATADSVDYGSGGLVITATLTADCAGGDLLSNDRFRLTAVDSRGRDVAAGVFNLGATPIALPGDGGTATVDLTFPAGTYWRTADATSGPLTLTAHREGRAVEVGGAASATSASAFDVGAPEHGSLDAAAFSALQDIAAADARYIDANLLDVWQPQLSSKRPGLYYDGITWQANDIVREHMQLRQRYPNARLLWSGNWPVYSIKNWWITVSGVSMPSGQAANDWCGREGYDADHCFAKMLSHSMGESGTTLNRK